MCTTSLCQANLLLQLPLDVSARGESCEQVSSDGHRISLAEGCGSSGLVSGGEGVGRGDSGLMLVAGWWGVQWTSLIRSHVQWEWAQYEWSGPTCNILLVRQWKPRGISIWWFHNKRCYHVIIFECWPSHSRKTLSSNEDICRLITLLHVTSRSTLDRCTQQKRLWYRRDPRINKYDFYTKNYYRTEIVLLFYK